MAVGDIAVSAHGPPEGEGERQPDQDRGSRAGRLAYNPALDGIRSVAVVAVLFFHGGFGWARGGYLGVSTFFTLSGFLITSLLVGERSHTGRIDLFRFWTRRLRRLFPASAITLLAVCGIALVIDAQWEANLQGDTLAALGQVANWRMLLSERSYADLFSAPSPLVHFWSLAIEEQFYWIFPLVSAGVFAFAKGSLRFYAAVLAGLVGISALATLAVGNNSDDTVYYSTYTRMGEILLGSLLAVGIAAGLTRPDWVKRVAAIAGVAALAASLWAFATIEQSDPILDRGGLLLFALVSTTLVLSATVPGPLRRVLAVEPLRALGVISYGVYLFHWPLFLVLDEARTGLDGAALMALRVAATLATATVSYFVLERPVRHGWTPRFAPMPVVALGSVAIVAAVAVAVPLLSDPPADPYAELGQQPPPGPAPDAVAPTMVIGIGLGDSTAFMTGWGLNDWGGQTELLQAPEMLGGLGCSIGRGGERQSRGKVGQSPAECDTWAETIPDKVAFLRERYGHADFALVQTGPWDVGDRRLPGDDQWRGPGDPVYDEYLRSEFETATKIFIDHGLTVVWLTSPYIDVGRADTPRPATPFPESDPARMDRLNEIIESITDEHDGAVAVDLAGYIDALPEAEDDRLRPDGVHFTLDASLEVAQDWLGPQVVAAIESEPVEPSAE